MKNLALALAIFINLAATAEQQVSHRVKTEVCDAMEFAMENPEGYDNDISVCSSGYTRERCLNSEFQWHEDGEGLRFDAFDFTCNCGIHVLKKKHPKSGLLLDIGGCA